MLFLLLAGLCAGGTQGQEDKWTQAIQAGRKAFSEQKYGEAEKFFKKANEEAKKFAENDIRRVAGLRGLAATYQVTFRGRDAEPLYERTISILVQTVGPESPEIAMALIEFAELYRHPRLRATGGAFLPMIMVPVPNHPPVPLFLSPSSPRPNDVSSNLAKAEPLYLRAIAILEKHGGVKNPNYATALMYLALEYQMAGRSAKAEATSLHVVEALESSATARPVDLAGMKQNLGEVHRGQKKLDAAIGSYQESISILEGAGKEGQFVLAAVLDGYAIVLKEAGRKDEAKLTNKRANDIREELSKQKRNL